MADNKILTHALSGALGGAAGVLAMRTYWKVVNTFSGDDPRMRTTDEPHALDEMDVAGQHAKEDESSTAAAGRLGYEAVTGEAPDRATKEELSMGVHWGYGISLGVLYGLLRRGREGSALSGGLAFGAAAWLLGDELLVPLLGLAKGPTEYPLSQHVHRLLAHLAFGGAVALQAQSFRELGDVDAHTLDWVQEAVKSYLRHEVAAEAGHAATEAGRAVTDMLESS